MRIRENRRDVRSKSQYQAWTGLTALTAAFVLLLGLGCSSIGRNKEEDPLLGPYKPKGRETPTTQANFPVPPIPEYPATVSTATMATALPLNGAKPLSIPARPADPDQGPGDAVSTQQHWTGQTTGNPSKPVLGPPQPIILPESQGLVPPTSQGSHAASSDGLIFAKGQVPVPNQFSHEELQQELKKRGVLWQREEKVPSGIRFICAVPHSQNSKAERIFEATATDAITAIRAVLVELDRR